MFRVGQKVVCVDVSENCYLALNSVYTIAKVIPRGFVARGTPGPANRNDDEVWLEEVGSSFYASRFRPVVDRKTDISIFTAMLNPSLEDLRAIVRENANMAGVA